MQTAIKTNLYSLTFSELQQNLVSAGLPSFRAQQVWQGMYQQLWSTWEQFTTLSKDLRAQLNAAFTLHEIFPTKTIESKDKLTQKILFSLADGRAVEAVLMRYEQRNTICISTQVGCAMNCSFCATGQMGFFRNLTAGEIVQQVLFFARQLKNEGDQLTNIVYMGMGEPFHNYAVTIKSIDILNDHSGFDFGERRFTISTVGMVPEIEKFTQEDRQVNLAISLHAANDDLRNTMLPINRKYPIRQLMKACRDYTTATRRRITFEYALIDGVNDTEEHARELAGLLKGMLCHVNLIPLNSTRGSKLRGSVEDSASAFMQVLTDRHIPCSMRLRRGMEIAAGCGQLATEAKENKG